MANDSFLLSELDPILYKQIAEGYYTARSILELTNKLDKIFLTRINDIEVNPTFQIAFEKILSCSGTIRVKDLATETYYSEKQMNRLFRKYAGAKIKTCSRIIRMKKAIELLNTESNIGLLFEQTGHHDYTHFVHDFSAINGITPKEYIEKMSIFTMTRTNCKGILFTIEIKRWLISCLHPT